MKEEIWKPVVGYEGLYEVSNFGRVRSYYHRGSQGQLSNNPRVLRPGNTRGYLQLHLRRDGVGAPGLIHRLVAEAFIGPPPTPGHQVNHKDFDKSNNQPENLEWLTQTENNRYSAAVIPRLRGEDYWWARKLTEDDVKFIRAHYRRDLTLRQLAERFSVSTQTVWLIAKRRKWKHVA